MPIKTFLWYGGGGGGGRNIFQFQFDIDVSEMKSSIKTSIKITILDGNNHHEHLNWNLFLENSIHFIGDDGNRRKGTGF